MATSKDGNLRYGISALALSYQLFAEKDELLVAQEDGKMHYKRESDGQIVTYESLEYDKSELVNAIKTALVDADDFELYEDDYLVYNTIDITEKSELFKDEVFPLNITHEFTTSKQECGFFIRVRGNERTSTIASLLENSYRFNNLEDTTPSVRMVIDVQEIGGITKSITLETDYNKLTFIHFNEPTTEEISGFKIKLVSITYPLLSKAYNLLTENIKEEFKLFNYTNDKFESDYIDIAYYSNDISSPTVYVTDDKIRLQTIIPAKQINREYLDSESLVISENKPKHKCIWGKIIG